MARALVVHPGADLYGSDRVLLESVAALVDDGWAVTVALPSSGPLIRELQALGADVVHGATPVLRKSDLSMPGLFRLATRSIAGFVRGRRLIAKLRPRFVYVNTITIPLWLVVATSMRVPAVCHVHEGEASASRALRTALALPLFLAHSIIANSEFSSDVLSRSFPRLADRTRVVYNAVPGPESIRPLRPLLEPPIRLVYLGRLSPRKGVDVAIDAIARLRARGTEAHLDLVGAVFPGYEWYERQLRRQASELGVAAAIRFHGFHQSVWGHVAAGDIIVVPSRVDEPFGNTAVEAILGGRPVIASRTSGLIEATAGYRCATLLEPGDPDALASAVWNIISDWSTIAAEIDHDVSAARSRHGIPGYRAQIARLAKVVSDQSPQLTRL